MKVTKEKAAENRERILFEAARLFRERGSLSVGMDALADAAEMTHGSLYSHFKSKEDLAVQALKHGSARNAERMDNDRSVSDFLARYLSGYHRDRPGNGCFMATLGCAVPNQPKSIRRTFTEIVRGNVSRLAKLLPNRSTSDEAIFYISAIVGAMVLARGVDDSDLSERVLSVTRARLQELAGSKKAKRSN